MKWWKVTLLVIITYMVIGWWVLLWIGACAVLIWAYTKTQEEPEDTEWREWV